MKLTAKTYAKINLTLDITGVREDGYHLLDTVMQSVSLFDTLSVEKLPMNMLKFSCDDVGLSGEKNICVKAAELFFETAGIPANASIVLSKNIPVAAGLGGGSGNAAGVLLLLNRLYSEPLDGETLSRLALLLGADVPYFLKGGTVRAKGIGEKLTRLGNDLTYRLLIVKYGQKPSTGELYRKIDSTEIAKLPQTENFIKAIKSENPKSAFDYVSNDFSAVWDFEALKKEMGTPFVSLSGSGPSVFGVYETEEKCREAYLRLKDKYECFTAVPVKKAIEIIE